MEEVNAFDLHAAFLRRAQGDIKAFLEALAARLEQALPGQVEVRRKKDSFFSKTQHVVGMTVHMGSNRYVLENAGGRLQVSRRKEIGGVVLKTESMPLPEWLGALSQELGSVSAGMTGASGVLQEFLMR